MKTRYGLEIRGATAADAQGICDLMTGAGWVVSSAVSAARLNAMRQGPCALLVAAEWGPPVGLVALHWYSALEADQPTAQITSLLVAPPERRRGIGRLLVKAAAQTARVAGCGSMELLLASDAADLVAFGSASGLTELGRRLVRPLRKKA